MCNGIVLYPSNKKGDALQIKKLTKSHTFLIPVIILEGSTKYKAHSVDICQSNEQYLTETRCLPDMGK
jgi:hypothetical protein